MIWKSYLFLALAANAIAPPHASTHIVHEKREIIEPGRGDRVPDDAVIPLRIGLKLSNLESGYDKVMDVSDPALPNYGMYLVRSWIRGRSDELTPSIE